jgi:hypothetical protein
MLFLCSYAAGAQATVTVSGTHVYDNQFKLLANGQLLFTVTDTSDTPITYTPQGGSATTATIAIPVKNGAVQYVGGYPPTIPNPGTMSPANTRYRMQVQTAGGASTIYTFPLVNITTANFTYDGYRVDANVTATGQGYPTMACYVTAQYNDLSNPAPYPYVCSQLSNDGTIAWTQNPSLNPMCSSGNSQAFAVPISPAGTNGPPYCVAATQAYATPGYVYASPSINGTTPGQIGLIPVSQLCEGGGCGGGGGTGALIAIPVSGAINGSNTDFTLAQVPNSQLLFMLNGQYLIPGVGYTLIGTSLHILGPPPQTGDFLTAISTQGTIAGVVTQISGSSGAISIHGSGVVQTGNDFNVSGGTGCIPGGTDNSILYKNATNCPGAQAQVDLAADSTGGSLFQPKMDNTVSDDLGAMGNRYWTNNGDYPQQTPHVSYMQQNFMYARHDFGSTSANRLAYYGTNRYHLPDNTDQGGDSALRYDSIEASSPGQIGGAYNLQIHAYSTGDVVGHTDVVSGRAVTEGFEEALEAFRMFYGIGWDTAPHGVVTFGTPDYLGDPATDIACGNVCGTFGENNWLINTSKKFVPSGNIDFLTSSTLLGGSVAAMHLDAAAAASATAKFGSAFHVAAVVSGADDRQIFLPGCPSVVTGTYGSDDPFNSTDAVGGGLQTANRCVNFRTIDDLSSLVPNVTVGCWWGPSGNHECSKVLAVDNANHRAAFSLHFPHNPNEIFVWGAGVGYAATGPKGVVPRRSFDNGASFQEETLYLTYPVIGWDATNSQLMLWPSYNAAASNEIRLPVYMNNHPSIPVTVSGTGSGGSFTSLAATTGGNYGTQSFYTGALSSLPPPDLSFNCTVAPTYRWDPDPAQNVPSYVITMLTGGSGCSSFTVTTKNTYDNPVWIYPATRMFRVQDVPFCNGLTQHQTNCTTGHNMHSDPQPNPSEWTSGVDQAAAQMDTASYVTGNEEYAGSPAAQGSGRNGPMFTRSVKYPQNAGAGVGVWFYANGTPGYYYWGTAASNWMPYKIGQDPQTDGSNPYLGTGIPPTFMGVGGTWGNILHVTDWVWSKNAAGKVVGGSIISVDCTHPGQDGEGAATPCRDRNIVPPISLISVNAPDGHFAGISADAENFTVDIHPNLTVNGANVCRTDPVTGLVLSGCPTINDYTITMTAPPVSVTNDHFYQVGSLPVAVDTPTPAINQYFVPKACNATRVDFTQNQISGTAPSSEGVQVTIWRNGAALISPLNFPWNGANTNHLVQTFAPVALAAGDALTYQFRTPIWASPPTGPISTTATIYCSTP